MLELKRWCCRRVREGLQRSGGAGGPGAQYRKPLRGRVPRETCLLGNLAWPPMSAPVFPPCCLPGETLDDARAEAGIVLRRGTVPTTGRNGKRKRWHTHTLRAEQRRHPAGGLGTLPCYGQVRLRSKLQTAYRPPTALLEGGGECGPPRGEGGGVGAGEPSHRAQRGIPGASASLSRQSRPPCPANPVMRLAACVFPEGDKRGRVRRAFGEGGRNSRRQGVPRETYGSWDLAFPQISRGCSCCCSGFAE